MGASTRRVSRASGCIEEADVSSAGYLLLSGLEEVVAVASRKCGALRLLDGKLTKVN